jgi:hypothetical protein
VINKVWCSVPTYVLARLTIPCPPGLTGYSRLLNLFGCLLFTDPMSGLDEGFPCISALSFVLSFAFTQGQLLLGSESK